MQNGLTFILAVRIAPITAKNTTNGKTTEKERTMMKSERTNVDFCE